MYIEDIASVFHTYQHILFMLMESYTTLGFMGILRETTKIFSKNVQLMASLTLLNLLLLSLFFLSNVFSTKPVIYDLVLKASLIPVTGPKSTEFAYLLIGLMQDLRVFIGLEWTYAIILTATSFFFSTATIIASAVTHGGENLFFKDLLLSTLKSLKRPFFTWFYITLLGLGYSFLVLENLLPMVLIIQQPIASKALLITIGILAAILYDYLAIIWTLAFVISVLEEKCGIEALGKAAQIVKGVQLHGFGLNILFTVLGSILLQAVRLMNTKQSTVLPIVIGLLVVNCICLVKMFWWMAYTVFYHHCKETHGEEAELQDRIVYSKIPTAPIFNEPR